jgi:TonB family protein
LVGLTLSHAFKSICVRQHNGANAQDVLKPSEKILNSTRAARLALIVCLLCPALLRAQAKSDYAALLQKAADLEDLRSPGNPSFQLEANLLFTDIAGKKFPGTYNLLWSSPDEWREEIHLGPYTRIRVGGPRRYWQQRSIDFELPHVFELSDMLDFASLLRLEAQSPNGKRKSRNDRGEESNCVEFQVRKHFPDSEICIDSSSGLLKSEKTGSGGAETLPAMTSREYSDFTKFGGKVFPKSIRGMAGKNPLIEFSVTHLGLLDHPDAASFAPPPGAQPWATCESPAGNTNELIQQPMPIYPEASKRNHVQGNVVIYAVIGEDGATLNLKLIEAPDKDLASSALTAVSKWRYTPKVCNGIPIALEDFIRVVYTLGG